MVLPRCDNRSHTQAQRSRSNHSTLRPRALTARHMPTKSFSALGRAWSAPPLSQRNSGTCLQHDRAVQMLEAATRLRSVPNLNSPQPAGTVRPQTQRCADQRYQGKTGTWSAGSPCPARLHSRPPTPDMQSASSRSNTRCQARQPIKRSCANRTGSGTTAWPGRQLHAKPG